MESISAVQPVDGGLPLSPPFKKNGARKWHDHGVEPPHSEVVGCSGRGVKLCSVPTGRAPSTAGQHADSAVTADWEPRKLRKRNKLSSEEVVKPHTPRRRATRDGNALVKDCVVGVACDGPQPNPPGKKQSSRPQKRLRRCNIDANNIRGGAKRLRRSSRTQSKHKTSTTEETLLSLCAVDDAGLDDVGSLLESSCRKMDADASWNNKNPISQNDSPVGPAKGTGRKRKRAVAVGATGKEKKKKVDARNKAGKRSSGRKRTSFLPDSPIPTDEFHCVYTNGGLTRDRKQVRIKRIRTPYAGGSEKMTIGTIDANDEYPDWIPTSRMLHLPYTFSQKNPDDRHYFGQVIRVNRVVGYELGYNSWDKYLSTRGWTCKFNKNTNEYTIKFSRAHESPNVAGQKDRESYFTNLHAMLKALYSRLEDVAFLNTYDKVLPLKIMLFPSLTSKLNDLAQDGVKALCFTKHFFMPYVPNNKKNLAFWTEKIFSGCTTRNKLKIFLSDILLIHEKALTRDAVKGDTMRELLRDYLGTAMIDHVASLAQDYRFDHD